MLLRDALVGSDKTAIATVVIRMRQHLAALKPEKELMLKLMYFPDQIHDEDHKQDSANYIVQVLFPFATCPASRR